MFIADLHIHSRFSMATSRQLTVSHLAGWAMCKGIHVLGTGDFTHPSWQAELEKELEYDEESGFYRIRNHAQKVLDADMEGAEPPLFCLQTEISSIYKRGGRSRRVHNLVFFKRLDDVKRFSRRLAAIGNIESDGRPILGLDAHDLLELVLETSDSGVLIPAHIWTPWYSLFGSKSGFDAIEECFGDLTGHIFALETGLSSDPAMNRLVSALDNYVLISNSDAHSGPNLGREANLFHGSPSYDGMFDALRRAARREGHEGAGIHFEGTLEIYPEEGKYHLDGHRNCHVVLTPEESAACDNICPVCGKPLTIGVLHRVWELADRKEPARLAHEPVPRPVIPLTVILGQLSGSSAQTRMVQGLYKDALQHLGSEFDILSLLPEKRIEAYNPWLAEAVRRIRAGEITLQGGYDGDFGTITIFNEDELKEIRSAVTALHGQRGRRTGNSGRLLHVQDRVRPAKPASGEAQQYRAVMPAPGPALQQERERHAREKALESGTRLLTREQEQACEHEGGPLMVIAGPGSGKTRLLIERMIRLLEKGTPAGSILALTFSRRAAMEIEERARLRLEHAELPFCGTFHALAWKLLRVQHPDVLLLSEAQSRALLARAAEDVASMTDAATRVRLMETCRLARERCVSFARGSVEERLAARYTELKHAGGHWRVDFADLLEWLTKSLLKNKCLLQPAHVLVDEVQDLSALQIRLLKVLLPRSGEGFFAIGDPDQSIYSFRGAAGNVVEQFRAIWSALQVIELTRSFRSTQNILDAAGRALGERAGGAMVAVSAASAELTACEAPSQGIEERWVAEQILRLLPATSHTVQDARRRDKGTFIAALEGALNPSDIAVLVRLRAQIPSLVKVLWKAGIPVQAPSLEQFWKIEGMDRVLDWLEDRVTSGHWEAGLGLTGDLGRRAARPGELVPALRAAGLADDALLASEAWRQLEKACEQAGSWEGLFEEIRWREEADLLRTKSESVRCMTMHAAKGLEFQVVFLPGFNQGLMPLDRAILGTGTSAQDAADVEEERRLLYVALTRASRGVFVSWARERRLFGRELVLEPSPCWPALAAMFASRKLVRRVRTSMVQGRLV